jgi:hypothetical protein
MNILEAYVEQLGYFNVIFSSVDYELLKKVVLNISKDFNAEFIDLFPIMINMEDIDNDRVKELTNTENNVRFIIVPVFPLKYANVRVSYHINISLNFKLINDRNIKKEYVDLESKYKDQSMVNKYMNLTKYVDNENKLEDDIFNVLISRITKKLDNGKYEDRVKSEEPKFEKKKHNSDNEFKTEKIVSKRYDHDAKEEYLDKKNDSIDQDILNEVDDLTNDPYKATSDIELEDVNMDDEMIPTNDYSSMEPFEIYNHDQFGGIRNNIIIGKRILKKKLGVIGSRMLK